MKKVCASRFREVLVLLIYKRKNVFLRVNFIHENLILVQVSMF